eukprot:CAMPEP_0201936518 /NCGR_PEP_ID=MMETSP0903-20130614/37654_1 /ASSEMBLY_ACC=CAM_ASM_000552 /TAXON_ID=420261 /ORGANISM="Thalassiosira antarctica, Strain CCMP982" /LENGTH=152 /DNA_ID=CAMNT_0048477225 /DNA_START=372 /DNA_END=829 /DNA_ORIENTATION=+
MARHADIEDLAYKFFIFPAIVNTGGIEERLFKFIGDFHALVDPDDALDQSLVNDCALPLFINQAYYGRGGMPLEMLINLRLEKLQPCFLQGGERMLLDIVSIKIAKDFPQPLIHSLMIGPAIPQFIEEGLPPLTGFVLEGGENGAVEILLDG